MYEKTKQTADVDLLTVHGHLENNNGILVEDLNDTQKNPETVHIPKPAFARDNGFPSEEPVKKHFPADDAYEEEDSEDDLKKLPNVKPVSVNKPMISSLPLNTKSQGPKNSNHGHTKGEVVFMTHSGSSLKEKDAEPAMEAKIQKVNEEEEWQLLNEVKREEALGKKKGEGLRLNINKWGNDQLDNSWDK